MKFNIKLAALACAYGCAMGFQPAAAQVDATGENVVRSTLKKSINGDITSGSTDGTVAGFLKRNAGKDVLILGCKVPGSRTNERANLRLKFSQDGNSAIIYTTEQRGGGALELCVATAQNYSVDCETWGLPTTYTEVNFWNFQLYSDRVNIQRNYLPSAHYCTLDVSYRYITQDGIDLGAAFTDWINVTPGACYEDRG